MRKFAIRVAGFWIGGVILAGWVVSAGGAAAPAVVVDVRDPKVMEALVSDLGSDDFAVREGAQARMRGVPSAQLGLLRERAGRVTDAEVKLRLEGGIQEAEGILATSVPEISLDLKDATLEEVARAMASEMGVSVDTREGGEERFTLKAGPITPWEAFLQLSAQHPLGASPESGSMTILPLPNDVRHRVAVRGIVVGATEPQIELRPDGAGRMNFSLTVALDPRLRLVRGNTIMLGEVVDNRGVAYVVPEQKESVRLGEQAFTRVWAQSAAMAVPAGIGDRVTLRGRVRMVMAMEEKIVTLEDVEKHLDEAVRIGETEVRLKQIVAAPANVPGARALGMKVEAGVKDSKVKPPEKGELWIANNEVRAPSSLNYDVPGGWNVMQGVVIGDYVVLTGVDQAAIGPFPMAIGGGIIRGNVAMADLREGAADTPVVPWVEVALVDAADRTALAVKVPPDMPSTTFRGGRADFKGPLKLVMRLPVRMVEVTVPFEIKDVPVRR